jgi:hypothetical protein
VRVRVRPNENPVIKRNALLLTLLLLSRART